MAEVEDEAQALRSQIKTLAEQGRHTEMDVAISRMRLATFLRQISAGSESALEFHSAAVNPRTNLDFQLPATCRRTAAEMNARSV